MDPVSLNLPHLTMQEHRLAAILFTDIVGSTAVMQKDEQTAVSMNRRYLLTLKQTVTRYNGEILNDYGDGSLCSFGSAIQAVQCSIELQQQLQTEPMVPLRIGLHIGEIFFEDGKVFGDGVNVASRIQSLGVANSVLFSSEINNKLKNQPEFKTALIGKFRFKNVDESMEVFALANEGFVVPDKKKMEGKLQERKIAGSKWIPALVSVFILTAAFFIYRSLIRVNGFSEGEKTIAVLPFENVGVMDTEIYISDGITQDIIKNLSKISSLQKVIGWFSVRSFRKTSKTLKEIADELGVAAILSGTMERHSDKIHIIAELIEVNTNKRLWGDDFEYETKDILSIQSKVAGEIVKALKANVTQQEKNNISRHNTDNVEAYKYYLKGRNFWNARSRTSFDSAEANFKRAIQMDPHYALAYAGLADCYTYNFQGMSQLEAIPIARGYANRALELDSNLSEGLTSLGFIQHNFDFEWDKSRKTLERAIDLDPNNPIAHLYYGNLLQYTGHTAEGLKEAEKAAALDPLAFGANWVLGRNYYFAGLNEQAIDRLDKLKPTPLQAAVVAWSLGLVYAQKKMFPEAIQQFDKLSTTDHNANPIDYFALMQSYGYALAGDRDKAKKLLGNTLKLTGVWLSPYRIAQTYTALGEYDKALEQLEKSYDMRDLHLFWIKVDPGFIPIRNKPRFINLMKKMNLE
jgi:TolB-like protein/class 3 adenylate cyclase